MAQVDGPQVVDTGEGEPGQAVERVVAEPQLTGAVVTCAELIASV